MSVSINDLWEAGVQDDKLALLFLDNKNANIAIKNCKRDYRKNNNIT